MFPCTLTDPSLQQQWLKHSTYAQLSTVHLWSIILCLVGNPAYISNPLYFYSPHMMCWVFLHWDAAMSEKLFMFNNHNHQTGHSVLTHEGSYGHSPSWHNHQGSTQDYFHTLENTRLYKTENTDWLKFPCTAVRRHTYSPTQTISFFVHKCLISMNKCCRKVAKYSEEFQPPKDCWSKPTPPVSFYYSSKLHKNFVWQNSCIIA